MPVQAGVSIAESVLGVNPVTEVDVLRTAYGNLMGIQLDDDQLKRKLSQWHNLVNGIPLSQGEGEGAIVMGSLDDIFFGEETHSADTLVDWPSYQSMMETHGRQIGGTALLIGSISPLSSKAFEVLSQDVYGAEQAVVIDIAGSEAKRAQANFVLGSGTSLPFSNGSISYVHTNRLLHMLKEPGIRPTKQRPATKRLFSEIDRVLAPDGQLFMQEMMPGEMRRMRDIVRFARKVRRGLARVGLEDISITHSTMSRDLSFLFDPTRDFSKYPVEPLLGVIDIFARKPAVP